MSALALGVGALVFLGLSGWAALKAKHIRDQDGQTLEFKRWVGGALIAFLVALGCAFQASQVWGAPPKVNTGSTEPPPPPELEKLQVAQTVLTAIEEERKKVLELASKGNVAGAEAVAARHMQMAAEASAAAQASANAARTYEEAARAAAANANKEATNATAKAAAQVAGSGAAAETARLLQQKAAATKEAAQTAAKRTADILTQAREAQARAASATKAAESSKAVLGVMATK